MKRKAKPERMLRCALCTDKKEWPESKLKYDKYFKQQLCPHHWNERFHEMKTTKTFQQFMSWASENFSDEELVKMEKSFRRYDA